jgi:Dolichyl-phosphate-mannose-protein mannosyltransferase
MTERMKTAAPIVLILLLCLFVRLGYLITLEKHPLDIPGDGYVQIAQNILAGKGFAPTPLRHWLFRTPGYPLFIAAVWSIVPSSFGFVALEVAQVVLSVATCGLICIIAKAVFGRDAALVGASLFAISPSYTVYCAGVFSETLVVFWVAVAAFLAATLYKSGRPLTAIGFGLAWGAAGLTRPESTVLLPALLLPVLLAIHLRMSARLWACGFAVLGKVVIMVPWVARNYWVYGAIVVHVPLGGDNLFIGSYPHPPTYGRGWYKGISGLTHVHQSRQYREITLPFWDEAWPHSDEIPDSDVVVRNEREMLEVDRRLAAAAWSNIKEHKQIQIYNSALHFYGLWGRPAAWGRALKGSFMFVWIGAYLVLLSLTVMGILCAWRSGKLGAIPLSWLIVMAGHTGVMLFFPAESRHQATSAFFLYVFAGLGGSMILAFPGLRARRGAYSTMVVGERRAHSPSGKGP